MNFFEKLRSLDIPEDDEIDKPKKAPFRLSKPKMFRAKFKGQCVSLTLEGKQCERYAEEGHKFCWQHLTYTGTPKIYLIHGTSHLKNINQILGDEYIKPLRLLDKQPGFFELDVHPERVDYVNQVFTQPLFVSNKLDSLDNWDTFSNYFIFDETVLKKYPNYHICKGWKYGEFKTEACERNNGLSLNDNIKEWKSMIGKDKGEVVFDFPPSIGNGININESGLLYIFCKHQDPMIKDLIKAYPQYNWVWKMPL